MPLHLYPNIRASGSVPTEWKPLKGGVLKYQVKNDVLHGYLKILLAGRWQKVIKYGSTGEVHYFEHESGQVADVKFFPND
jgi:hypothetical protein